MGISGYWTTSLGRTQTIMTLTKYLNWSSLTFVATLAGIAVPVWLWFADLNSRSLVMSVVSQTPLTSETAGTIKGLQVSVDGVALTSPSLSVIQITNDGKKPIPATDFEGALEVRVGDGSQIIRTEVTSTSPRDIQAKLTSSPQVVQFQPLLLNPEDALTFSVLTSGKHPVFQPRARIAGIATVKLSDSTAKIPPMRIAVTSLIAAVLLFAASDIANSSFVGGQPFVIVRRRAALLVMTTSGIAGMACFFVFFKSAGLEGLPSLAGLMFVTVIAGAIIAAILNRGAERIAKPHGAA